MVLAHTYIDTVTESMFDQTMVVDIALDKDDWLITSKKLQDTNSTHKMLEMRNKAHIYNILP